ncbi:GATA transcription factor 9 [Striga hermonthica]|uniref:GATA transcription factor n=1 Tax=Striga hermonthica TaxID=68872 RepID=A0A9N7NR58_STRHE|nr:GATA transcription factor 9 [Striga hermonthica]
MEYFSGDCAELSSADNVNFNYFNASGALFTVDDLLDFSKEDETIADAFPDGLAGNPGDSSTVTAVDSCNSSVSGGGSSSPSCRSFNETQFPGDELCIPYDDLAELEWLSNFVEESFSAGGGTTVTTDSSSSSSSSTITTHLPPPQFFPADASVPGRARSKRSRAAPCDWSSRLFVLSPKAAPARRREPAEAPGRRCLHCDSEKTPQWRTGPMGPKTLCNACGVRYKSGRLVPEYRPAASPTFVSSKHSNSHRKVMELRRLKEVQIRRAHHQPLIGDHLMFNGCDEFLIHQHSNINGLDFRHMI